MSIWISLRICIISRATEGLDGVFFEATREGVEKFGREARGFEVRVLNDAGVAGVAGCCTLGVGGMSSVASFLLSVAFLVI
jgi:hypothetical protein